MMDDKLIYLDNAATSHPKPDSIIQAMSAFMRDVGGNPGRSGHRLSIEAGRVVFETRERVTELFGVRDSSRVVFGQNATEAINLGLKGFLRRGDHVITSSMEHNSVMRPLRVIIPRPNLGLRGIHRIPQI
jgi:cysteine desulfurase/selenocysteine lyase